tara:strand:+ start:655 stop:852 length:198 start_codon:yes stop_codon:yes gene_type:complete
MPKYLKITAAELESLIETAESCKAIGEHLADEATAAERAHKAVLKRNGMTIDKPDSEAFRPENMR